MTMTRIVTVTACLILAAATATPAMAQSWDSYRVPGSNTTRHISPDGWSGTSTDVPGNNRTDTIINGPNGQTGWCSTYRLPGSANTRTICN